MLHLALEKSPESHTVIFTCVYFIYTFVAWPLFGLRILKFKVVNLSILFYFSKKVGCRKKRRTTGTEARTRKEIAGYDWSTWSSQESEERSVRCLQIVHFIFLFCQSLL